MYARKEESIHRVEFRYDAMTSTIQRVHNQHKRRVTTKKVVVIKM